MHCAWMPARPAVGDRRLAASLLAALALHLVALAALRLPDRHVEPAMPSVLQWVRLASPRTLAPSPATARPGPVTERHAGSMPGVRQTPAAAGSQVLEVPSASEPSTRAAPASAELLDSARGIVRQMAREPAQARSPDEEAARERHALPSLDRTLNRKAAAGESRLANGIIRIRTASGREYCLQPPPGYAGGGPAEALAVPTNCQ